MEAVSIWSLCKIVVLSRFDRILDLKRRIFSAVQEPSPPVEPEGNPQIPAVASAPLTQSEIAVPILTSDP